MTVNNRRRISKARELLRRISKRPSGKLLAPTLTSARDARSLLFIRDYRAFTGGHLKAWDYFNHVLASEAFTPSIWFSPETVWDQGNPWTPMALHEVPRFRPDAVFIGGPDWVRLPEAGVPPDVPVINLIQGIRHTEEGSPRYEFLARPAIRICVSNEVAHAINATGRPRGPVITIPNGIDTTDVLRRFGQIEKDLDLLIVANKRPDLGRAIAQRLTNDLPRMEMIGERVDRNRFLTDIARARVALFLPIEAEGFYLPPLEAMTLQTVVVCPDCIGNRSFCLPGETAFVPEYDEESIVAQTQQAVRISEADATGLRDRASRMSQQHDLMRERGDFLGVLDRLDELWAEASAT